MRREVAKNPAASQDVLSYLADDSDDEVRELVAMLADDPAVIAKLANDTDVNVRIEVASRTNDPAILAKLADDESRDVRWEVAWNADDLAILAKLADDEVWDVRSTVASRTDDSEILAKLANDRDNNVRATAQDRRLGTIHTPKKSKPKKPTQTEWSIPIYELQNYSDIQGEIDGVISDAVTSAMTTVYPGEEFTFEITANSYDEDGQLVIQVAEQTSTYDLQTLLPMATFSQKKKDCIKKLADYLIKNI